MKYRICEMMLNEYVNHPTEVKIDEIEASSQEEAQKLANLRWPNRGPLKVAPADSYTENNCVDYIRE